MRHALWSRTLVEGIVIGAWARSQGEEQGFGGDLPGVCDADEDALRKQ